MARNVVSVPAYNKTSITGIKEIRDRVAAILNRTTAEHIKKDICLEAGQILVDELHATAPQPSKGNKDFPSGTLQRGIFMGLGKSTKASVQVGISAKGKASTLAGWIEYGTVHVDAEPFFRPAIQATKSEMAYVIGNGLQEMLKEETE